MLSPSKMSYSNETDWSGRGCSVAQRGTNFTVCQCSHLTSFAIVMNPEGADEVSHNRCLSQQLLMHLTCRQLNII